MSRVVITGIGTTTPAGATTQDFWKAVTERRSITEAISLFDASRFRCHRAAEVKALSSDSFPGRKSLWKISRSIALAFGATQEALQDSGIDTTPGKHPEIGVVF